MSKVTLGSLVFFLFLQSGCVLKAQGSVKVKTGHFFGHDLTQAEKIVYVLDLSGSMNQRSGSVVSQAGNSASSKLGGAVAGGMMGRSTGNSVEKRIADSNKKIEIVKLHMMASLQGLPNGAQFNIVLFSDGVQKLAPGMLVANGATKTVVGAFIDRLKSRGSTNMYAAMEAALNMGAGQIILLTDGLPTSSSPDDILGLARSYNQGQIRVSTVGVGNDQAFTFLRQLAQENGGSFQSYQ